MSLEIRLAGTLIQLPRRSIPASVRKASQKKPEVLAASRRLRYAVSGSLSSLGRSCSLRLLPSWPASRAQQSAVIWRLLKRD